MEPKITRREFLKKSSRLAAVSGMGACGIVMNGCRTKRDFDIVIKNGRVYDGSGGAAFAADIAVSGGVITELGKIPASKADLTLDARDFAVCPGFIDAHDHTDVGLLVNPRAESSVRQGITTVVSGNCGYSPFPVPDASLDRMREEMKETYDLELSWRDIQGFFSRLNEKGMALNYATLVGQGMIRSAVVGLNDRPPEPDEMAEMKSLVEDNIRNGAVGLSSGLEYAPSSYAKADEIIELCRAAADKGGLYATHMRDEGDHLIEALEEAIDAARKTGIRLQVSHFKVGYQRNWHKIERALAKIESAAEEGIDLYCDRYPYTAAATGLSSMNFPLWAKQGTTEAFLMRLKDGSLEEKFRTFLAAREKKLGSWDKVIISSVFTEKNRGFEGKTVRECAGKTGKDVFVFLRDLLIEEEDRVGQVIFMMSEDNLKRILAHPLVGVGCDGQALAPYGPLGEGKPHPRSYGTFPRVLGKYIREEKIVPMGKMIKKMTAVPARNFGFAKRGMVKPGYFADLVVFNKSSVIDRATFERPHQYPEGIEYVLVNGRVVIDRGEHTGSLPGKILGKRA